MATNRLIGGLFCFEVLEGLSDYVDGELDADLRRRVEAHLEGCDECARFGDEFSTIVAALRERLRGKADVSDEVARRLEAALRK